MQQGVNPEAVRRPGSLELLSVLVIPLRTKNPKVWTLCLRSVTSWFQPQDRVGMRPVTEWTSQMMMIKCFLLAKICTSIWMLISLHLCLVQRDVSITADSGVVFCSSIYSNIKREGFPWSASPEMGSQWAGLKRRALSSLFWYVRLTHQPFPSACHSWQHNEPVARLGSLKKHQQSSGPPGTARAA